MGSKNQTQNNGKAENLPTYPKHMVIRQKFRPKKKHAHPRVRLKNLSYKNLCGDACCLPGRDCETVKVSKVSKGRPIGN